MNLNRIFLRKTYIIIIIIMVLIAGGLVFYAFGIRTPISQEATKVLVVGFTESIWGIDPANIRGFMGHLISFQIFEPLLRVEFLSNGTMIIVPNLAEKWYTPDGTGKEWIFELRKDVRFHDGTPFNATAVKFSFERTIQGKQGEYFVLTPYIDRIEILDTYKVKFILKQPYMGFPSIVAGSNTGIVSPTAVEKCGADFSTKCLVGTGPFKFIRWIPNEEIVLQRNDDYWNKSRLPRINLLVFKIFSDSRSLALALEQGKIDVAIRELLPEDKERFKGSANYKVFEGPDIYAYFLAINLRNPYLNNTLVRQAIAYALDYDRIAKLGYGFRIYGLFWKGQLSLDIVAEPQRQFIYDPDKARKLLMQAFNGSIPKISFKLIYNVGAAPHVTDIVSVIKSNLEDIGISVELVPMDSTRHISTLNSGKDFDLSFFVFNPLTIDPDWSIWFNYHTEGSSAYQRFGFTNKTIDQLIMKARSEPDPEVRRNIYILIQNEVDSVPMQRIYLFRPYTTVVANKWVIGDLTPVIRIGYAIDFTRVDIDISMKPRG